MWSSDGVQLKRIGGVNGSFTSDSTVTYKDYYNAWQLNTSDDGKVYQCEVLVNSSPPLIVDGNITLDAAG